MDYALYTGCTTPVIAPHYEVSARRVCESLNIDLELLHAPCCGNPLKPVNEKEAVTMALYVLSLAGRAPLMTLCSACTSSLLEAKKRADTEPLERLHVDREKIERLQVKHFIQVLVEEYGLEPLRDRIEIPLDCRVAVHYGCHFHRPSSLYSEDPEYPHLLDDLVEICGACSVPYRRKSMCCGSPVMGVDFDVSVQMTAKKLQDIKGKADIMVITCSGCGFMFDRKQKSVESLTGELNIPVLYYSQFLGLALGIPPEKLGFEINRVPVKSFLEKVLS
ncbi:MAG: CoB--CoM heterodisulfide reductase iron-sulfur subunit B family protein [Theionarchaea archaeon]|nr:CoB--CoM heterodisulfide reductase iron-sulfur subunit B family protein [Theionarchaea archaeon]